eukprot:COSAG06_NODE_34179_length_478_cov_1.058047_1_plen_52_part_01
MYSSGKPERKSNQNHPSRLCEVPNGRFVTVIAGRLGAGFADICPRPHRVSVL